jgi:hypothetical protein
LVQNFACLILEAALLPEKLSSYFLIFLPEKLCAVVCENFFHSILLLGLDPALNPECIPDPVPVLLGKKY